MRQRKNKDDLDFGGSPASVLCSIWNSNRRARSTAVCSFDVFSDLVMYLRDPAKEMSRSLLNYVGSTLPE